MIDPIKRNEEHSEAVQDTVTKENLRIRSLLSEQEAKEFEAVDKAFKILSEAGVATFMFPLLMTPNGRRSAFQYNNFGSVLAEHKDGLLTKKSMVKISYANHMTIVGVIESVREHFCSKDKKTMTDVFNTMYELWRDSYYWYNDGTEPKHISENLKHLKDE
jgi:hypothetical protein